MVVHGASNECLNEIVESVRFLELRREFDRTWKLLEFESSVQRALVLHSPKYLACGGRIAMGLYHAVFIG